jgi:hypothetical protein
MPKPTPDGGTLAAVKQYLIDHPVIAVVIAIILFILLGYVILRILGYL